MATFTPYLGTLYGPRPYSFPGVTITSFVLSADILALQAYCDKFLNIGPQKFSPVGPYVIFGINRYPKMISIPDQNIGFTSRNEYYFMFPVLRYKPSNFFAPAIATEVMWAFPYIGVDNATSAFCGRELLGFQKAVGEIDVATDIDGRFSATVKMPGAAALAPNSAQQLLTLLTVQTGLPQQPQPGPAFPWSLWSGAVNIANLIPAAQMLLSAVTPNQHSLINLKQFFDPINPTSAIYRKLIKGVFQLTNTGPSNSYDNVTIKITDNPTMSVVPSLGIQPGPGGALVPLGSTSLTTDMRLDGVEAL